jgi:hypothetical protein
MDAVEDVATPAAAASGASCDPRLCSFAAQDHAHCCCGIPVQKGAALCALCLAEGLDPIESTTPERGDDPLAWDGLSYPSRRRRRIHVDHPEFHLQLVERVLQPGGEEEGPAGTARSELRTPAMARRRSGR